MQELYLAHRNEAQFLLVYVREAGHPNSELAELHGAGGLHPPSQSCIRAAMEHYGLDFPCLLDSEDHETESAYDAWPERLIIVDQAGRIALDAGRGLPPFDWDFDRIEAWLSAHAGRIASGAKTPASATGHDLDQHPPYPAVRTP